MHVIVFCQYLYACMHNLMYIRIFNISGVINPVYLPGIKHYLIFGSVYVYNCLLLVSVCLYTRVGVCT